MALLSPLAAVLALVWLLYIPSTVGLDGGGESTFVEKGLEYIPYVGVISGVFHPNDTSCNKTILSPSQNASLNVGVAGPWDTNPFWFQLAFAADDGWSGNFQSADLLCYDDSGNLCSDFEFRWYFVAEPLLNLNQTTVQSIALDGNPGYQVVGNETSYISNGLTINMFSVAINMFTIDGFALCPQSTSTETLYWANTARFTYNLAFTNNTASMSATLNTTGGYVVLNYTGNRTAYVGIPNNTVILNTSDATKPEFTFLNGSKFKWYNASSLGYGVTDATSMAALLLIFENKQWTVCVLAAMVFAILL